MKAGRLNWEVLFGLVWAGCGSAPRSSPGASEAGAQAPVDADRGAVDSSSGTVASHDATLDLPNVQPPPPAAPQPTSPPPMVQPVPTPSTVQPSSGTSTDRDAATAAPTAGPSQTSKGGTGATHVFVIAMENQDASEIYGSPHAPYINNVLLPAYASAADFVDVMPGLDSEPHYVWMEAGTNAFADHTFRTDDWPSKSNSTGSTQHLATQITSAGLAWMEYVEGANLAAEPCPITPLGPYVPHHDPFLFFQDVSGAPPSGTNASCAAHHKPLSELESDLASGDLASYVFITPDLCDDMHGDTACPAGNDVQMGDSWLSGALPPLITYLKAAGGVIFIVWDQGNSDDASLIPFLAVGPSVKPGYRSPAYFTHGSLTKTVEEILRLPILPAVQGVSDLGDLFDSGAVP